MRPSGRQCNEIREITLETGVNMHAEGSCLVSFGNSKIICTASIEERVPRFLYKKGTGWVTAEYSMLPRATGSRNKREISQMKQSGRTLEIQRLIARSLRSTVDMKLLGERQIIVDCDVIQADGGTRTASITGAYVALYLACQKLVQRKTIRQMPIINQVAAVSCGLYNGQIVADLDYAEDSKAYVDTNFVMNSDQEFIEIQGTAEKESFSDQQLLDMIAIAKPAISQLIALQKEVLEITE